MGSFKVLINWKKGAKLVYDFTKEEYLIDFLKNKFDEINDYEIIGGNNDR